MCALRVHVPPPSSLLPPPDVSQKRWSGKFWLLDHLLTHLFAHGHRVLIFSQYVETLTLLEKYLSAKYDLPPLRCLRATASRCGVAVASVGVCVCWLLCLLPEM
jgi:SNF2 family DNA or RNA helicase